MLNWFRWSSMKYINFSLFKINENYLYLISNKLLKIDQTCRYTNYSLFWHQRATRQRRKCPAQTEQVPILLARMDLLHQSLCLVRIAFVLRSLLCRHRKCPNLDSWVAGKDDLKAWFLSATACRRYCTLRRCHLKLNCWKFIVLKTSWAGIFKSFLSILKTF